MKIYFTASISGADESLRSNYRKIIKVLEDGGHTVIANHILGKNPDDILKQSETEAIAVQKKMSTWKKQADLVLVEATTPSFGVGQEIAEAINDNKQVVVLYMNGHKPHILVNQGQEAIYFAEYELDNLKNIIDEYIEYAKIHSDTRFNFFISPSIGSYLDWISRKKKIPRAVYLRKLIEDDMKVNVDFEKDTN